MEESKHEADLIHVPQGRSARLIRSNLAFGIEGLYSDGFSNCILVACIGKDKITLTHADIRTNPLVTRNLIKWVDEPNETIIISRMGREIVFNQVVSYLQSQFPGKRFIAQCMPAEYDGTIVSFTTHREHYIHPQIRKLPISVTKPKNLLLHPQEERFLAVQKIEQAIGVRAANATNQKPLYQQIIFDGFAWEPLDEKELRVNATHTLTREEMAMFTANDALYTVHMKLIDILMKLPGKKSFEEISDFTHSIAYYLEGYLNNYDALRIFKRNINDTVTGTKCPLVSNDDKKLKADVLEALNGNESTFEKIQALFAEYEKNAPVSDFKKMICNEFTLFFQHYHDTMSYRKMTLYYQEKMRMLAITMHAGMKHFQAKEYPAATNIFKEALKLATICCLKNSPELVKVYFHLGISLQQETKYQEAYDFLRGALSLRESYVKSTAAEIEIVKKAVAECKLQLERSKSAEDVPNIQGLAL